MPIYKFKCNKCNNIEEIFCSFSSKDDKKGKPEEFVFFPEEEKADKAKEDEGSPCEESMKGAEEDFDQFGRHSMDHHLAAGRRQVATVKGFPHEKLGRDHDDWNN